MYKNSKIKNVQIDYVKMANTPEYVIRGGEVYFGPEKVRELLAMACEDVWPNGNYGDAECCLWGMIREVLCKENFKDWNL